MGQVTLTTAEYNTLLLKIERIKACFQVRPETSWYGGLSLAVDMPALLKELPELVANVDSSKFTPYHDSTTTVQYIRMYDDVVIEPEPETEE